MKNVADPHFAFMFDMVLRGPDTSRKSGILCRYELRHSRKSAVDQITAEEDEKEDDNQKVDDNQKGEDNGEDNQDDQKEEHSNQFSALLDTAAGRWLEEREQKRKGKEDSLVKIMCMKVNFN